jgi:hypothetical protein
LDNIVVPVTARHSARDAASLCVDSFDEEWTESDVRAGE